MRPHAETQHSHPPLQLDQELGFSGCPDVSKPQLNPVTQTHVPRREGPGERGHHGGDTAPELDHLD